ncbi:MAG: glycosyltransferase [Rickettsia endosymbiont of Ixodes persulcatus]|nr:glycosyltransferase [Rickettsia endosymbiont of Ixodes persulcatus]
MEKTSVLIVIVLYHPDEKKLLELIHTCCQTSVSVRISILLFDNAQIADSMILQLSSQAVYYQSSKNVGVSGAYYYASEMASSKNFNFLLLLDQDSQLPNNFMDAMLTSFFQLQTEYPRLAAIGPAWNDPRFSLKKKKLTLNKSVAILISSGMLIWVPVLRDVGFPKKNYIIDHVDTEWCLRAFSKNYQLIKLQHVHMQHTLGEVKKIAKVTLRYHQPIRYYYRVRNGFFIFRDKDLVYSLRLYVLLRNVVLLLKVPFLPKPVAILRAIWRGLKEGVDTKGYSE